MIEWIKTNFRIVRRFVADYIGEFVCGLIAISVLIFSRWFLFVLAIVAGVIIFFVNRKKI